VLVVHGGPGLSDYTAPLAAELEDAFGVIRYQQRGLAPSTTSGPFGISEHVADAIAVLDAAGTGGAGAGTRRAGHGRPGYRRGALDGLAIVWPGYGGE
jgi:hypothetical protein